MTDTSRLDEATNLAHYRVVIADDDAMIREALSGLLDDHPSFAVVGSAENGWDAAQLSAELHPHLVVLDVMMECGGIEGLSEVLRASPESSVVFYTAKADRRTRQNLLDAGAAEVFAKGAPIDLADEFRVLLASRK